MKKNRLGTCLITLLICLFSVNILSADDYLGPASISNDSSFGKSSNTQKKQPTQTAAPVKPKMPVAAARPTPFDNFKGHLLRYTNGNFERVTLDDPSIEYYVFYFSAHWCNPCRQFTPKLISAYKDLKNFIDKLPIPKPVTDEEGNVSAGQPHKNFEVILVSWDRSKQDMFDYVKATQMPWLMIDYDQIDNVNVVKNSKVEGIPTLLVYNKEGKLIIGSTEAYVSPNKVLDALEELIKAQQ